MAKKKKKTTRKETKSPTRVKTPNQMANLAKLTALQMLGFVVFEIILCILVAVEIVPSAIVIKRIGLLEISMNTGYLVLVGLVSVLVASFWLAILVQFKLVKLEEIEIKL